MFRRLMTVTSVCLKASSMDARFLSVSFFLWPTGKRNVVSSIPRMLERNIWLGFFSANDMGKQNAEHCFVCFDDK